MSVSFIKVTSNKLFRSTDNLEKRSKQSNSIAKSVGRTLQQQSVFKRQSIAKRQSIYQKRKDGIRRKQQRDLFEASKSTGAIRSVGRAVTNSTKGFLGRILDAIAITMVGWAVINLPTIISLSKQLGERIVRISGTMSNFMSNTLTIFQEIGTLSSAFIRNLIAFDFSDMGRQVDSSLSKVRTTFNRMEIDFFNAINILVQPFDFGEDEKPPGGEPPSEEPPPGGGKQNRATRGTKEQRALLDAIAFAEGTSKSYGTVSGGGINKQLEEGKLTVQEVINLGNSYGKPGSQHKWSGATGRYQFMPFTLSGLVARGQLKANELFTPAKQDEAALMLIERRGVSADMLRQQGLSVRVADLLAPEFASFPYSPTGKSYYGQSFKPLPSIQQAYQSSLGSQQTTQTTPRPQTNLPPNAPQFDPNKKYRPGDNLTQSIGRGVGYVQIGDVMGASRGGGRKHAGIDIQCPFGTYIALRLDSEVMFAGWQDPNNHQSGYGQVIDLWVPQLGVQLRFGHCAGFLVSQGKVPAGKSFARVGSTGNSRGPHIHFEYTRTKNRGNSGSDGDPSPYIPYILLTGGPNAVKPGKSTPAQITGTRTGTTVSDGITPENGGKTLVVAAPPQLYQNPAMMTGSGEVSPIIVAGPSLNSLIKQRMLLELAYT